MMAGETMNLNVTQLPVFFCCYADMITQYLPLTIFLITHWAKFMFYYHSKKIYCGVPLAKHAYFKCHQQAKYQISGTL